MNKLNNDNTDTQKDVSFLTEEQKALQSIYEDLREMETQRQRSVTKFFTRIKRVFVKDSVVR